MARTGINPEKILPKKLNHKAHRIIIPVYIPNREETYFQNALDVLKISLKSLINTVDLEKTNITIINNNSCDSVSKYLLSLLKEKKIDKLVQNRTNRGKVEPVLSEALASYEEYITIADADLYYFPDWLNETFKIFNAFPSAGVVSPLPMPHLFTYYNLSCLAKNLFKIKFDKITPRNDLLNFEKSIGSKLLEQYYEGQFYIKKDNCIALLGASHVIATYKNIFHNEPKEKIPFVFLKGQEEFFIDNIFDRYHLCRLSTPKAFVYHIGNKIDNIILTQLEETNREFKEYLIPKSIYVHKKPWLFLHKSTMLAAKLFLKIHKKKMKNMRDL